jgi:hypothetical protein
LPGEASAVAEFSSFFWVNYDKILVDGYGYSSLVQGQERTTVLFYNWLIAKELV